MNRLITAVISTAILLLTSTQAQPLALGEENTGMPCREDLMAHVHHPTRLIIVSNCVSVSGTVKEIASSRLDGDIRMLVDPDTQYAHLLAPSNNGLLVVKVIPTDQPSVFIPSVGQHATFSGALVVDKASQRRVAIHPTWLITTADVTGPIVPRSILDVMVNVTNSVSVGDELRISINVNSMVNGTARAESEVRLFLEIVSDKGKAVRWKAIRTNTLGIANLNLAALEGPGNYTLWVYASKRHDSGVGKATFKIKHR